MIKFICENCGNVTEVNELTMEGFVKTDNSTVKTITLEPSKIKETKMTKKDVRLEKLEQMGFDVKKMTSMFSKDGLDTFLDSCLKDDPIAKEIYENGYVKNSKLHRRFVMAQTFKLLGDDMDWTKRIHKLGYTYQFKMTLEELRVLSKLEKSSDYETFEERKKFFTKDVVIELLEWLKERFSKSWSPQRENDRTKLIFYIEQLKEVSTYKEMYEIFNTFMKSNIWKRYKTYKKCQKWVSAYKGAGAYYTLKNMIMYHNCYLYENGISYNTTEGSLRALKNFIEQKNGDKWYRLLAILKETIKKNNFNFKKRMQELYS